MRRLALDRTDAPSLRSGFVEHAERWPDRPALAIGDRVLGYGELDDLARRWAGALVERCQGPPERVGIFAYRSEAAYAGTLAALYAGATFVPLNRHFPVERTRSMVERADLDAIVVDRASAPQLGEILGDGPTPVVLSPEPETRLGRLRPDRCCGARALRAQPRLEVLPPVVPEDLAYLLFTSGTTGTPKGVAVSHGNVTHFLDAVEPHLRYTPDDRTSQTFDQTFDLAVFDLFATWRAGACLCVPQANELLAPARYVNERRLTVWFSVPSLVAHMRRAGQLRPDVLPTLRLSLFCGEALPRPTVEAWEAAAPSSRIVNLYGPTELTIACCAYRWDSHSSPEECWHDVVAIGRPLAGLGAVVVDEDLGAVPDGESGELCVCGPQASPGYWRDPDKTDERFVPIELSPGDTRRFYRTGDRVVRMPSGNYVYLGRTDHQVKIHGYRVELGEIEASMLQEEGVTSAAAVAWPLEEGRPQGIVAFATGRELDAGAIRNALRSKLPGYAVPSEVVVLEGLPLNVNGKTDRAALKRLLAGRGDGGRSARSHAGEGQKARRPAAVATAEQEETSPL